MTPAMKQLSRGNLMAFVKATMPNFSIGWVHREICGRLMSFFVDVIERKSPRLIITMPPRHGKSELVSRRFPAWCFGVNPNISIISANYGEDLSRRMNKDVQRIMDSNEYQAIFPNSLLSRRNNRSNAVRTMDMFEIPFYDGSMRTTGVGGGITGMGCDILIIDDPFKDRQSADSPTIRGRVWDWYASTAYTRLSPGGGVLITVTRWHEDDLVGRLLSKQENGDKWKVVNYPALAEHDEPKRKEGEALLPERYNVKQLNQIKNNIGSYDWAALYQQHPTPRSGGIFKGSWIRHWQIAPTFFDRIIQSWDFTFKDAQNSDYVAGQIWGRVGANYYLLDAVCEKMDFVSQVRAMRRMADKWPQAIEKIVEDKANGPAIIAALGSEISGLIPYNPRGSKTARAYAVSPLFESGNVFIPPLDDSRPWVKHYLEELLTFPSAPHDDQVDATTQALDTLAVNYDAGILNFL